MLATHRDAEERYTQLRKVALEAAQQGTSYDIIFSLITQETLDATIEWDRSPTRRVDWNWIEGYGDFKFRYPKRFEVAIWHQKKPITLSLGRPTYQGTSLRLDFIEARPKDLGNRPSIFSEVLVAYGIYARLINARQIRIMNPINEEVKNFYESFGYQYIAKKDYLYREIV